MFVVAFRLVRSSVPLLRSSIPFPRSSIPPHPLKPLHGKASRGRGRRLPVFISNYRNTLWIKSLEVAVPSLKH